MSKTSLIIFSYNRPMQLDATLDSVQANLSEVVSPEDITVIFRTNDAYRANYERLMEDYKVNWVEQDDFKQDVLDAMKKEYTLMLCDDDIVFEKCNMEEFGDNVICFSYRLGLNTNYCYSHNEENNLLFGHVQECGYQGHSRLIEWRQQRLDLGYPLSVTAHLFKTKVIKDLTERGEFENPNVYEGQLQRFISECPDYMMMYKHSRIVGVPANRVNESCMNRHGLEYKYTEEELNDKFTEGYRIDWRSMDFSNINAAQQELPYVFKKD